MSPFQPHGFGSHTATVSKISVKKLSCRWHGNKETWNLKTAQFVKFTSFLNIQLYLYICRLRRLPWVNPYANERNVNNNVCKNSQIVREQTKALITCLPGSQEDSDILRLRLFCDWDTLTVDVSVWFPEAASTFFSQFLPRDVSETSCLSS